MEGDDLVQSYVVNQSLAQFRVKKGDWVVALDSEYIVLTNTQYNIFNAIIVDQIPIDAFQVSQPAGLYSITDAMVWDTAKGCYTITQENGIYLTTPGTYILRINDGYRNPQTDFLQQFYICIQDEGYTWLFT
jgi:hypothetical protein